jgi:hypothetical protein
VSKTYNVSLDVYTDSVSLAELASLCGCSPSAGSHSRGEIVSGRLWRTTRLRISSAADSEATIDVHLKSILAAIDSARIAQAAAAVAGELAFDIAIFFDTPMASVTLPYALLGELGLPISSIEVAAYPSDL